MRMVITKRNYETVKAGYHGPDPACIATDSYRERLLKYIPVEMVVLYVAVYGCAYAVFAADPLFPIAARWILIAGIVATPLYLLEIEHVTDWVQLVISTAGFVLWGFALGVVPLSELPGYNQIAASLALPLYIGISPLIEGRPERW
jgi:hypothetical protein